MDGRCTAGERPMQSANTGQFFAPRSPSSLDDAASSWGDLFGPAASGGSLPLSSEGHRMMRASCGSGTPPLPSQKLTAKQRAARQQAQQSVSLAQVPVNGAYKGFLKSSPLQPVSESVWHLPPECEDGPVEYKLKLVDPTPSRFQQLVTQMQYRLGEGGGEAAYMVGVCDDGTARGLAEAELQASLRTLRAMAAALGAAAVVVADRPGTHGRYAEVRVRRLCADGCGYRDLRVAVAGAADSGKSTLVAVLTHGADGRPQLDSGRGSARTAVLRHKHEIATGRTSSRSQQLLGYDNLGRVLNYSAVRPLAPAEIGAMASTVVTFIDLGGGARFLKSALFGMTCLAPDAALIAVSASAGIGRMTREHHTLALALRVPVLAVITKTDASRPESTTSTITNVQAMLGGADRSPVVTTLESASSLATTFVAGGPAPGGAPIFVVSSVTGDGLDLLHAFLAALPARRPAGSAPSPPARASAAHFQVEELFAVGGVGAVASGAAVAGAVEVGSRLLLGPTAAGGFVRVRVACIQRSQLAVARLIAGQAATLALERDDGTTDGEAAQAVAPVPPPVTESVPFAAREKGRDKQLRAAAAAAAAGGGARDSGFDFDLGCQFDLDGVPPTPLGGGSTRGDAGAGTTAMDGPPATTEFSPPAGEAGRDGGELLGGGGRLGDHKGLVLLAAGGVTPRTCWEFDAAVALVGVSHGGGAPTGTGGTEEEEAVVTTPTQDIITTMSAAGRGSLIATSPDGGDATAAAGAVAGSSHRRKRSTQAAGGAAAAWPLLPGAMTVVHCGSVRQAARVVDGGAMETETTLAAEDGPGAPGEAVAVSPSAAALVRLRFVNRPEWLQEGMRVVVRAREGRMATAAGVVRRVL